MIISDKIFFLRDILHTAADLVGRYCKIFIIIEDKFQK